MAQDKKSESANGGGVAFGITSLTAGIIAFLTGWIFFISIPLGIVAVVFAALGLKKSASRNMAIAGLIAGIIGLAFGLGILIIGLAQSISAGAPSIPVERSSFFRY